MTDTRQPGFYSFGDPKTDLSNVMFIENPNARRIIIPGTYYIPTQTMQGDQGGIMPWEQTNLTYVTPKQVYGLIARLEARGKGTHELTLGFSRHLRNLSGIMRERTGLRIMEREDRIDGPNHIYKKILESTATQNIQMPKVG